MRFFLVCPAGVATGGTELLHQFAEGLSDLGIESYMLYPDEKGAVCPTPEVFLKYGVKYVCSYVDASDAVLVLAETQVHLVNACKKGMVMIWWLSVDNYFHSYPERFSGSINADNADIYNLRQRPNVIHFVQSYYAKDFAEKLLGVGKTFFLKDYISDEIVETASKYRSGERENICLYNPKKGFENLRPVIEACRGDIEWIPLKGLTPAEMARLMCRAKVYVDFGSTRERTASRGKQRSAAAAW